MLSGIFTFASSHGTFFHIVRKPFLQNKIHSTYHNCPEIICLQGKGLHIHPMVEQYLHFFAAHEVHACFPHGETGLKYNNELSATAQYE